MADDAEQVDALFAASFEKLPSRRKGIVLPPVDASEVSDLMREGRELALRLLSPARNPADTE